ncbi:LacI family DNA-binding transcriptional regulator [Agromyces sp. SYSU T00194]|uniref:LacI family DNA-binding transcriptional regulator n=1 Tax=Agromyces chitinivorans TaxID=3158560 RepID=UPI003395EA1B
MPRAKRLSLADVATIAGVSISTVSKVANGGADVSDATRERVQRVLDENGYVSTRKRRSLSTVITLIARDMHSPFTLEVIRGAMETSAAAGARLMIAPYPEPRPTARWVDELAAAGTNGLLAVTSRLDREHRAMLADRGIELVAVDPVDQPDDKLVSIGSTNWSGAYTATQHLLELGHRRIALLGGLPDILAGQARISGFEAAIRAAGVDLDPEYHLDQDFTFDSGIELGSRLLALPEPPTGIIAASDFQALGVVEAARRVGVRVPDQLSVIGFDDLIVAQMSSPPLTTVHQPIFLMGSQAVQQVLALLSGDRDTVPPRTELATRLIVRASTAAPSR